MTTGHKRREPAGAGSRSDTRKNAKQQHTASRRDLANFPFVVEIDAFGRRKEWARFATADDADAEIAKLRRIGFRAQRVSADSEVRR
jgi:hypothetical protein